MKKYNIAIVGATGLVGSMFLKVLKERKIPIAKLYLFASAKSVGKKIKFRRKNYVVQELTNENIIGKKIHFALFSAGEKVSKEFAEVFMKNGACVIDNSSAFRMDKGVPLVVPEVNPCGACSLIANPNCSTIQCMPPLKILDELFGLKQVDFTTMQAVSGSGQKGLVDLERTKQNLSPLFYPHPIFNNCLPHIGNFDSKGWSKEELKMVNETKKILDLPKLNVSATCVRVPVQNCHSIAITVRCKRKVDLTLLRQTLADKQGIVLLDNPQNNIYPLATLAKGKDEIFVGRIKLDLFSNKVVHLFCVCDNIRKGAATNAIQILQQIIEQ